MNTSIEPQVLNTESAKMVAEEARRLLVEQRAALDALRTRAVAMLSVASVVAGLFGSRLPKKLPDGAEPLIISALTIFAVSVGLTLVIVAPRRFNFQHTLNAQLDALEAGTEIRPRDLSYTWAKGYERDRGKNRDPIDFRMTLLQVVCVLVGLQVICWGVAAML